MPERFTVADLWGQAFTATYNAELRSEKAGKGIEIYDLYADRYQQMMPLLYRHFPFLSPYPVQSRRQKVAQKTENLEYFAPKKQRERKRKRTQALWLLRRIQGKCLTIARLLKATTTFEGGADYIVWKISRHSGVEITLTPWQRKHPILAGFGLFLQLRRKGAFR